MFKRIFLFITVNILVVLTISITLRLLGIDNYFDARGINYSALLVFCAVVGFMGAFISLLTSRWMAKKMMGVRVIDPASPQSSLERDLVQTIHRLAQKAGLPAMPEVGIYDNPEVNAFATGPSKSKSIVAVSTGLLHNMDTQGVEGVLGHEISHIANGDMVTMTLLQGVVNTFVLFFARIAAWAVSQAMAGNRDRDNGGGVSPVVYWVTSIAFEIVFSLLGAVVVAYFSRKREFRADRGGANLAGRDKMVTALRQLKEHFEMRDDSKQALATLKINGKSGGLAALFSTHPDLDTRINALMKTY